MLLSVTSAHHNIISTRLQLKWDNPVDKTEASVQVGDSIACDEPVQRTVLCQVTIEDVEMDADDAGATTEPEVHLCLTLTLESPTPSLAPSVTLQKPARPKRKKSR